MSRFSVFNYSDFRVYLRDSIDAKRRHTNLSLESLARKCGGMTKGHLSLILAGKRNLTSAKLFQFIRVFGLTGSEVDYFRNLVLMNQAKTNEEKELHLAELAKLIPDAQLAPLPLKAYRLLESWHAFAIRELARLPDFDASPSKIAARLRGRLSSEEAAKALSALVALQMLKSDDHGRLRPTNETLKSADEISSIAIRRYHKACLDLGRRAIDEDSVDRREVASVNLLLSPDGHAAVKQRIKAFRDSIAKLAESEGVSGSKVCQLNLQFFELSD